MRLFLAACLLWPVSAPAQETAARAADLPTFTRDVAPILYANCVTCHRPGEIGPFPLQTYQDARKRARQLSQVTGKRIMPPWKPDAGHGEFQDERRLTDRELGILSRWAEGGAPEGNPKDLPALPKFRDGWKLGKPDLVLKVEKPYAIPADGKDVYAHFVFQSPFKEESYVVGVEVLPGNRRIVHHAVGILDSSGTARKIWDAHGKQPYVNAGGPGFVPAGFTPGYVPGQTPRLATDGTAITIKPGTDLVLQIHYHPSGKVEQDQTQVGFYVRKEKPTRNGVVALLGSEDIDIPAGDPNYKAVDAFVLPVDLEIKSIWPHLHMAGKQVEVWAELPDRSRKPLLKISDWDFNWQDTYVYKDPFRLPRGTRIVAEFTWDNSAANPRNPNHPPKRIPLGEGSTDEMAGLIIGGHTGPGFEEIGHWAAVIGHYFEIKGRPRRTPK